MPLADFKGIDSAAIIDDASFATWFLQYIRENAQFIEDERLPQQGHIYRIHYNDDGVNRVARLPRWHAAQWVCRGPFLLWVPKHITSVSMTIRYLRDNADVRCLAFSHTKRGILGATTLEREHTAGETWTGTFTSGTEATLTLDGIEVQPNTINMIWLAFVSDQVPHPGVKDFTTDKCEPAPPDQIMLDELGRYGSPDNISSTPERWLRFSSDASTLASPVEDGSTVYTMAKARYDDVQNAAPISVVLAEHAYADMPSELPTAEDVIRGRGYAYWGFLGVVEVYGIGFDLTSGASSDFERARNLRWFQPPGLALLQLMRRIKEAHFIRQPAQRFEPGLFNYGSLVFTTSPLRLLLYYYPGHWRVFEREKVRLSGSPATVYEWSYRHSSSFQPNHTPVLKVAFCALYVSSDMTEDDTITVSVTDIFGVVQASTTVAAIQFASLLDPGSWLARWIRYVDRAINRAGDMLDDGSSFSHDGMCPPWEIDKWPLYEVEVDVSGLVADNTYRCALTYDVAPSSLGTTAFGGLHCHLEGNDL